MAEEFIYLKMGTDMMVSSKQEKDMDMVEKFEMTFTIAINGFSKVDGPMIVKS